MELPEIEKIKISHKSIEYEVLWVTDVARKN